MENTEPASAQVPGAELRARVGLLLPAELAALLGVEVRTLASWRGRKVGPDYVASEGGARIYYRLQDVEAWLEMQVVPTDRAA